MWDNCRGLMPESFQCDRFSDTSLIISILLLYLPPIGHIPNPELTFAKLFKKTPAMEGLTIET